MRRLTCVLLLPLVLTTVACGGSADEGPSREQVNRQLCADRGGGDNCDNPAFAQAVVDLIDGKTTITGVPSRDELTDACRKQGVTASVCDTLRDEQP